MKGRDMDDFRTNYAEFSEDLKTFLDLVSTRFKEGAPATLQHVKIIPTFLEINDQALGSGNVKDVLGKFSVVADATSHVFDFLKACVQDQHKEWVDSQVNKLNWWMGLCTSSLAAAISKPQVYNSTAMSAGIGGANTGVQRGTDPATWEKLEVLWIDIQKFAKKMGG